MRVVVVVPPDPVVTWADADAHLKLDGDTEQQAEVEAMIAAATQHIDGPDGWLGRSLGIQTLEVSLDRFDAGGIILPFPPISSVTTVSYIDTNGLEQTLDSSAYRLLGDRLVPVFGGAWPETRSEEEAVTIRFVAGYDQLPAPIRAAILLMVGDLYRNRGEAVIGAGSSKVDMSPTVRNLLAPFRVWR
ncbi:hypothetical protein LZK98_11525 [Sphingomonas cannabina]|uniref:head-tail connector protein n=1 Tax=Sphingomonas cannabina TaxID=2899123 RepID=UPI001F48D753|nr:hypothetical protein [Sphingomonas cannabina]UIJ43720.1 hypothetical protein LZK98_11525 [Sphingomonas cannabina]